MITQSSKSEPLPATTRTAPLSVAEPVASEIAPLDPDTRERVEAQVDAFVEALLSADLHSEDFRKRIDSAFKLGRREITEATRMNSSFLKQSYRGLSDTVAFESMARLRTIMDQLDPGKQGDLLSVNRFFGIIPGGTKLKAYLRRFQSAESQIAVLIEQLAAAQDDLERDVIALEEAKGQLWTAMQNLRAAGHFAKVLQDKLQAKVEQLRHTVPLRAKALEQEALYYAAQNLEGILTQQAVTTNGYLALDPLKKTARELSIGIDRLKTTGTSALAIAQMLAIATGNQARVQAALTASKAVVSHLVVQTSVQLGQHVQSVGKNASDPLIEIGKLQTVFDNTFKALDVMDNFRSAAIANMVKNNAALETMIEKSKRYVERASSASATGSPDPALAGPVAL
jgi:uncharacterized protein YaaN involved in tellurite resistance